MAADHASRIGVDLERHWLSRPHPVELDPLEVRRHPYLVRHEHGEVRARLCELTDGGPEVGDAARLGCRHRRIGKIEFRLIALSFGLREARNSAFALRLQRLDLPLRQIQGCLGALQRGLLLMQLRGILLGVLTVP